MTEINKTGRCHIGVPGNVAIAYAIATLLVDIVMTGVYLCLLRPLMKSTGLNMRSSVFSGSFRRKLSNSQKKSRKRETIAQKNLKIVLWKSIIGGLLTMLPTVANMVQFMMTKGRELAVICLTLCVVDGMFHHLLQPILSLF